MATENRSWVERFTSVPENQPLLEEARLIMEVTELIAEAIEAGNLTRAQVADRMGRSAPFVTQLLSGDRNMTLRSVAGLACASGIRLNVSSEPLEGFRFIEEPITVVRPSRTTVTKSQEITGSGDAETDKLAA